MLANVMAVDTGVDIDIIDTRRYEPLQKNIREAVNSLSERKKTYYEERGIGNKLKKSPARCIYYTADMVAEILGVSIDKAYKIIRSLNVQLEKKGYIVIAGRVPKKYFHEKYYGLSDVAHLYNDMEG